MWRDQIIEELHKFREEYARQFNFDINAICQDFRLSGLVGVNMGVS